MKKLLFVLLTLVAVVVAVVVAAMVYFDAGRYRDIVENKLSAAAGGPVTLKKVSLGWHQGLAVGIDGIAARFEAADGHTALAVERIELRPKLAPFLRKKIEIDLVNVVRPRVEIRQKFTGPAIDAPAFIPLVRPSSLDTSSARDTAAPRLLSRNAPSGALPDILVRSATIKDGELHFIAESLAAELKIKDIDVTFKNISFVKPVDFEGRMALFSKAQNVGVRGQALLATKVGDIRLSGAALELDLGKINIAEMERLAPAVRKLELRELSGMLTMSGDDLILDAEAIGRSRLELTLSGAGLESAKSKATLSDVSLEASLHESKLDVSRLRGVMGGGRFEGQISVYPLGPAAVTRFDFKAEGFPLDSFLPAKASGPQLKGKISLTAQGEGRGLGVGALSQSLSAQGQLALTEAVVLNFNVLREIFSHLSMMPGAAEALQSRLPDEYRQKLNAEHTYLLPMQMPFVVSQGAMHFDSFRLLAEDFALTGAGHIGLDGSVDVMSTLQVNPALSFAMYQSVRELRYFMNPQGAIEIPVRIAGPAGHVKVIPDTQYLINNIAAMKGQELISDLLKKKSGTEGEGESQGGDLLKNFF